KKIVIAAASMLFVASAHANQELVLDQIEANPSAPVKSEGAKSKSHKTEPRSSISGWYFEEDRKQYRSTEAARRPIYRGARIARSGPLLFLEGRGAGGRIARNESVRLRRLVRQRQDHPDRKADPALRAARPARVARQARAPYFRRRPAGQGFL